MLIFRCLCRFSIFSAGLIFHLLFAAITFHCFEIFIFSPLAGRRCQIFRLFSSRFIAFASVFFFRYCLLFSPMFSYSSAIFGFRQLAMPPLLHTPFSLFSSFLSSTFAEDIYAAIFEASILLMLLTFLRLSAFIFASAIASPLADFRYVDAFTNESNARCWQPAMSFSGEIRDVALTARGRQLRARLCRAVCVCAQCAWWRRGGADMPSCQETPANEAGERVACSRRDVAMRRHARPAARTRVRARWFDALAGLPRRQIYARALRPPYVHGASARVCYAVVQAAVSLAPMRGVRCVRHVFVLLSPSCYHFHTVSLLYGRQRRRNMSRHPFCRTARRTAICAEMASAAIAGSSLWSSPATVDCRRDAATVPFKCLPQQRVTTCGNTYMVLLQQRRICQTWQRRAAVPARTQRAGRTHHA